MPKFNPETPEDRYVRYMRAAFEQYVFDMAEEHGRPITAVEVSCYVSRLIKEQEKADSSMSNSALPMSKRIGND